MATENYVHKVKEGAPDGPLIFAFHGTGGDENQFFDFAGRLMPKATVISPRGDVSEGGALRFFRRAAEGVYDMDDLSARRDAMAAFIAAHRTRKPGVPVYGLGYSNGANILAAVMFAHAELFDGAFLMHPLIPWRPDDNAALAGKTIIITAGRRDPICPAPETQALADYFKEQGSLVDVAWHDGGHEIQQSEIAAAEKFAARVLA